MLNYEEKILIYKVLAKEIKLCNLEYQDAVKKQDKKAQNEAVSRKVDLERIKRKLGV